MLLAYIFDVENNTEPQRHKYQKTLTHIFDVKKVLKPLYNVSTALS